MKALVYIAVGAAAIYGAYWYYTNKIAPAKASDIKTKSSTAAKRGPEPKKAKA